MVVVVDCGCPDPQPATSPTAIVNAAKRPFPVATASSSGCDATAGEQAVQAVDSPDRFVEHERAGSIHHIL